MKYKILKALDVSGFTFLSPVVLLCYGEEPKVQLKKIGQFIVVPLLAVVAFIALWAYFAPKHKTKSGEVPTPSVVMSAASDIWTFHDREDNKVAAYRAEGDSRELQLQYAEERLAELEPLEQAADEQVQQAELLHQAELEEVLGPVIAKYERAKSVFTELDAKREEKLQNLASLLPPNDTKLRKAYLKKVREHMDRREEEKEALRALKDQETELRREKFPELQVARDQQTAIAEERQYLTKLCEQLSTNNRSMKIETASTNLKEDIKSFYAASGPETFALAERIAKGQQRIEKTAESEYAKPWTLPDQILRSLACVFFGFLLGSAIAIPIGVLCGLSKTFMAAVTPFIAIFKPVSPIVWLPIALIIVGGFIPDPDKHWMMELLHNLPLIGWMKINPAFIASGVTVALCSLWPTLVNTALGVASIDKDHLNVARVLRLGFWNRLFKIVVPSALPLIFAGLRISLGVGWMVLIAAELLSSSEGLGKYVWDQFNNGASDSFAKMFVVVFVVGIIGFVLDRIMIVFQRLVSFDGAPAAL